MACKGKAFLRNIRWSTLNWYPLPFPATCSTQFQCHSMNGMQGQSVLTQYLMEHTEKVPPPFPCHLLNAVSAPQHEWRARARHARWQASSPEIALIQGPAWGDDSATNGAITPGPAWGADSAAVPSAAHGIRSLWHRRRCGTSHQPSTLAPVTS